MDFSSDNAYGVLPQVLAALGVAGAGPAPAYGEDALTARLGARFCELFEHDVAVFPVISGTAANALALATLVPPHGAILCHGESHIAAHECGAAEFFTHGAKVVTLEGEGGKLSPSVIEASLAGFEKGFVHQVQPAAISLTQCTELGAVYRPEEIAAIGRIARAQGLKLHMDGARFANALTHLKCTPAEATWRAGVDVLSFGATKNGALGAEAVVFFDRNDVRDFEYRRKKGGHLLSKMRFVSAQLEAYLADGAWLKSAARANALAEQLAAGLKTVPGAILAYPVQSNAVFVHLPETAAARLREAGASFHDWAPPKEGVRFVRLVTSFATPEVDVERFVTIARG